MRRVKCLSACLWLARELKLFADHARQAVQGADSVKVTQLVDEFRSQLRIALMVVVIRRAAATQQVSGLPERCIKKYIQEAAIVDDDFIFIFIIKLYLRTEEVSCLR